MDHPHAPSIERVEGTTMAVNSYLVTGPDGLVVVDAQLTLSDAATVRAAVERSPLPLAGVLITHPHPDHYAGADVIVARDDSVPIVCTAAVDQIIRRDDAVKAAVVGPMMRPSGRHSGGSDAAVFCGDVVYHGMHAYLADGRYGEWIELLDALGASLPDDVTLYVGHGEPGSKDLLVHQRRDVEAFVDAVGRTADLDTEDRARRVTAAVQQLVPGERLLFLMQLSIEPVLATIRGDA
jgi:glyoxylase-like metal-dependent hydrolase (beta-lactamase superfamily II)